MPFIKHEKPAYEQCIHPEHDPPNMIVLPPGTHTYECPSCGFITIVRGPTVTMGSPYIGMEDMPPWKTKPHLTLTEEKFEDYRAIY